MLCSMTQLANLRSRTTQNAILTAFAERLRTANDFAGIVTSITDQPIPHTFAIQGGRSVTVSPGPGSFPDNAWTGAHHATATENGSVIVSIFVKSLADRPGEKPVGVSKIAEYKRLALRLLTVDNPSDGASGAPWEPLSGNQPLCRDIPVPVRCSQPMDVPEQKGWIGLQLTFAVTWDWDLYSE